MGISSLGLSSGIDFENIITSLIAAEGRPLLNLRSDEIKNEVKNAEVLNLKTKLSSFESAVNKLNSLSQFNTKAASITNSLTGEELASVFADDTASVGTTSIKVLQLAKAGKKISQGFVDQDTASVSSSTGTLKFKVGAAGSETTINVGTSTTLEELRDSINNTSGVTASIINDGTGSNPFRLILTSDESGSNNDIVITNNDTDLDFTNKKIEDAFAFTTNSFSGAVASNTSDAYTGTTNKTFLVEIVDDTGGTPASGTVTYKYSIDGGITFLGANGVAFDGTNGVAIAADATLQNIDGQIDASTTTEGVKVSFTGGTFSTDDKFSIDVFNPELQEAKDAVIEVDNAVLTKSSNTITDVIQGVTLDLVNADSSSTLTLSVSQSSEIAKDNIENFVDAFNDVATFLDAQLSFDPETDEASPLLGDITILTLRRRLGNILTGVVPGVSNDSFTNLSSIGITSNSTTAKLSIDDSKLSDALSEDPDAVARLFVGVSTPTNANIEFVSNSSATQAGVYNVTIATAPEQATFSQVAKLGGGGDARNDLSVTGLTAEETLTFLFSSNSTDNSPDFKTFNVTLSAGSTINTIVNDLNSAFATNEVALSASNDNGKLEIKTNGYGEDLSVQVSTNLDGAGQLLQDTNTISGETFKDSGVDIVGFINNHAAIGIGNLLTGASSFPEEGLTISTTSAVTGGHGTVAVSSGVANQLSSLLETYTNSTSGILTTKTDSIQNTIDGIKDRQEEIEKRLEEREASLRAEFTRLESIIAEFSATGDFLTAQLGNLPKLGRSSS